MSRIKQCFTSRWGDEGVIAEFDYAQIEVVVQAFLSNDKQMKEDVRNGVDFHCKRLAYKLREDYANVLWKCIEVKDPDYVKMRKHIKVASFRRAYGAGAPAIAEALGIQLAEAKAIIKAEEELYPEITKMQNRWITQVESTKKPSSARTHKGFQACRGYTVGITGKRYVFTEEDVPSFMQQTWVDGRPVIKRIGFKPTKIKNFEIQGTAGELLYMALGKLARALLNSPTLVKKCLLINTVHDSILFDIHKSVLKEALELINKIMVSVPQYMEEHFGWEFDLPTPIEISYGPTWLEQSVVEVKV